VALKRRDVITDFFQVVLQVPEVEPVCAAYAAHLNYRVVQTGPLRDQTARRWGGGEMAGAHSALLQPESGAASFIRLVEGSAMPSPGTLGWNAVELLVSDLNALANRLQSTVFTEFSPPQALSLSADVRLMQVLGPAGELLFLTEMNDRSFGVSTAQSPTDRPFIVTCGTLDVPAALEWFRTTLGMPVHPAIDAVMPALNRIYGLAEGTRHPLGMVKASGPCILEFDGYPAGAPAKAQPPGRLPPGVALVSCSVDSLDALPSSLGAVTEVDDDRPYSGARATVLRGPEGFLIELVERTSGLSGPA
jgi:catechol 2,3-dioxygenase-like lactoylglutathione lyase family enzyme